MTFPDRSNTTPSLWGFLRPSYGAVLGDFSAIVEMTEDRFGGLKAIDDLNVFEMYGLAGDRSTSGQNRDAIVKPPEVGCCGVGKGCGDVFVNRIGPEIVADIGIEQVPPKAAGSSVTNLQYSSSRTSKT